jgi:hypothetical protein
VVFISNSEVATANAGSNDITIFQLQGDILNNGTSYQLSLGSTTPLSIAYSPINSYLATADGGSHSITLFTVANQTADNAISYSLPDNSTDCVSVTFAPPIGGINTTYLATANSDSNDVTLFILLGQGNPDSMGTNASIPIGIIVGATVGGVILIGLTIATAIGAFILCKHLHKKHHMGRVNISLSSDNVGTTEHANL